MADDTFEHLAQQPLRDMGDYFHFTMERSSSHPNPGGAMRLRVTSRKMVAFDRLLARLVASQPDLWALKGGLALQLQLGERARRPDGIQKHGPGNEVGRTPPRGFEPAAGTKAARSFMST